MGRYGLYEMAAYLGAFGEYPVRTYVSSNRLATLLWMLSCHLAAH